MRAFYLEAPKKAYVKDLPEPELHAGEVLVAVEMCGVCGTDLGGYLGISPVIRYPVETLGHEAAGRVLALGDGVKGFEVGDRVALEPYISCGVCYPCSLGFYNNCENIKTRGIRVPGMMAEFVAHPAALTHRLPESLTREQGALIEPLTIGIHVNRRARVAAGEYCLITGAGPIGIIVAMVARHYGAIPIMADPLAKRLAVCAELGFKHLCNNAESDLENFLRGVCDGGLPHALIECSGAAPVVERCSNFIRNSGRGVFVGWPKKPCTMDITACLRKEIDMLTSRNSANAFPEAIAMTASGAVDLSRLITATVPLSETADLFEELIAHPEDHLKAVVSISSDKCAATGR